MLNDELHSFVAILRSVLTETVYERVSETVFAVISINNNMMHLDKLQYEN